MGTSKEETSKEGTVMPVAALKQNARAAVAFAVVAAVAVVAVVVAVVAVVVVVAAAVASAADVVPVLVFEFDVAPPPLLLVFGVAAPPLRFDVFLQAALVVASVSSISSASTT